MNASDWVYAIETFAVCFTLIGGGVLWAFWAMGAFDDDIHDD